LPCKRLVFSGHAVRRMFERSIGRDEVAAVVASGEVISEYSDDTPFPSVLLLYIVGGRPLHVVVAEDAASGTCYIVTAYPPDLELWNPDFKTRRTP
jgi:hypothetical protein